MNETAQKNDTSKSTGDIAYLVPIRRAPMRLILLAAVIVMALVSGKEWYKQLGFVVTMGLYLGSYPRIWIARNRLHYQLVVGFYPFKPRSRKLDRFTYYETEWQPNTGIWAWAFIGFFFWALDRLIPWVNGSYKIWLRSYRGNRVLAWCGNSESDFHANLDIFAENTDLPFNSPYLSHPKA